MLNPIDYQDPSVWMQWRQALADYPDVLKAIDTVEDCEGDLEDAAITLALQARLEPDGSPDWLRRFAKRYRSNICREFRHQHPDLPEETYLSAIHLVRYLAAESDCPNLLIFPVALWVLSQDLSQFCQGIEKGTPES
ncbi:MAG: hypothetical protein RLZZ435_90 [Cyanobacteriota bacterium]